MPTADELSAWLCEHYRYELLMLRYTHARLSSATNQLEWNALFESCAMHARNLRDFYCGKGKSNTRKANDYCGTDIAKPNEESGAFIKINEQMDHPSTSRAYREEDGKLTVQRIGDIVRWLQSKHATFIDKCQPEKKRGWDEALAVPPTVLYVPAGSSSPSATNHISTLTTSLDGGVEASE